MTMPHYKDGTVAKVGDQVAGKLYNSEGVKAGTIVSITPDQESCNAMVQFTEALWIRPGEPVPPAPRMAVNVVAPRIVKGAMHGTSGEDFALFTCADYCATNELTKLE